MLSLGYDIGSSSIKATLMDVENCKVLASVKSPKTEMEIMAPKPGWAEQRPEIWWEHVKLVTRELKSVAEVDLDNVYAIGLSYQMHGLVVLDKNRRVLRPAIIWCDSRAVDIGNKAYETIGPDKCLRHFLNSPGNFTASKLKWVMDNEPSVFNKIDKAILPGDYIGMRMTGEIYTTISGLSEAILWDFQQQGLASQVLDYFGIPLEMIPTVLPAFSFQGELTHYAASELGLKSGIKITYRAGDQPNNALSLNVLNPGELAASAGTSGVIYGVSDTPVFDPRSRVNTFIHVNHSTESPRFGILLCINGTGIVNSWLKHNVFNDSQNSITYRKMNKLASKIPIGSDGLIILPYGNGAERTLKNADIGASIHGLNFNTHNRSHFARATQEGVAFALNYGMEIMRKIGIKISVIRAGYTNMFISPIFSEALANVIGARIELYDTDGSKGAAIGAGIGANLYETQEAAFAGLVKLKEINPEPALTSAYLETYKRWLNELNRKVEMETV